MKYQQLVSMPSAVSDWLEEQLEARGLDSVVYTRYILSLLHSDTVDVICSDDDFRFFRLKKEEKRSGVCGRNKRLRRSSTEWWSDAVADAEKLKRSAVVECLMSASEQTCGIESLVDELCEKLKEIKSDGAVVAAKASELPSQLAVQEQQQQGHKISPRELADKYYTAFPALSTTSQTHTQLPPSFSDSSKIASTTSTLVAPKWISSPKRKLDSSYCTTVVGQTSGNGEISSSSSSSGTKKLTAYEENMMTFRKAARKIRGANRRTSSKFAPIGGHKRELMVMDEELKNSSIIDKITFGDNNQWQTVEDEDEEYSMYSDLPPGIVESLLDDDDDDDDDVIPRSNEELFEGLNMANFKLSGAPPKKRCEFIQSGTNITTSIWSEDFAASCEDEQDFGDEEESAYDNRYMERMSTKKMLQDNWWRENERFVVDVDMVQDDVDVGDDDDKEKKDFDCWSTAFSVGKPWPSKQQQQQQQSNVPSTEMSLHKLNHSKITSPFVEFQPRSSVVQQQQPQVYAFDSLPGIVRKETRTPVRQVQQNDLQNASQFRPIRNTTGEYADGDTFTINNNWEEVVYQRSPSGALYVAAINKTYRECKVNGKVVPEKGSGLVLKYEIHQNDIFTQTETGDLLLLDAAKNAALDTNANEQKSVTVVAPVKSPAVPRLEFDLEENNAKWMNVYETAVMQCCATTTTTTAGNSSSSVVSGKLSSMLQPWSLDGAEPRSDESWCSDSSALDFHMAESDGGSASKLNLADLREIWGNAKFDEDTGQEPRVSRSCMKRDPFLCEDVSQDGDQLLSAINVMQSSFCSEQEDEELSSADQILQQQNNLANNNNGNSNDEGSFDNFSWGHPPRVESYLLSQATILPTLRAVSLL